MVKTLLILLLSTCPVCLMGQVILAAPDGGILSTSEGKILQTELPCGSLVVTDVDGNSYNTVAIGTQCWLRQNLTTTRYNDGTAIPKDNTNSWQMKTSGAYCDVMWGSDLITGRGFLYNWYVVDILAASKTASNGSKNVCPINWHVPTNNEWITLQTFLGGSGVAGGKMKETGTSHWSSPNTAATNESGFTSIPAGFRRDNATWDMAPYQSYWWTTDENSSANGITRYISWTSGVLNNGPTPKGYGCSIRCLRDY